MGGCKPDRCVKNTIASFTFSISVPLLTYCCLGCSLSILGAILAVHTFVPSLRAYTTPYLELPHYHPETGKYTQGLDDVYFIISSMLGFTATRAIVIDWLFYPIASQLGLRNKQSIRFAEQGWLLVYYLAFWAYGMVSYLTAIFFSLFHLLLSLLTAPEHLVSF